MTSLDYYAIEDLFTDDERGTRSDSALFAGGSHARDPGLGTRAAVVQLTGTGSFDIPDASTRCE